MYQFIRRLSFFILIVSCCSLTYASEQLLYALDIIRHGDREALNFFANTPSSYRQQEGQLTAIGVQQEIHRGQALRQRYIQQYALLSPRYRAHELFVEASPRDRTLMSAQAVMVGLYPPRAFHCEAQACLPIGFQPVPIYSFPKSLYQSLVPPSGRYYYDTVVPRVEASALGQRMLKRYHNHFLAWQHALNSTKTGLILMQQIPEAYASAQRHHIDLPQEVAQLDFEQVKHDTYLLFARTLQDVGSIHQSGYPYLQHILNEMQDVLDGQLKRKAHIVVAHDVTIMGLLAALGAPLDAPPPLASDLRLNLFLNDKHEPVLEVALNGVVKQLPACEGQRFCQIHRLEKWLGRFA